MGPCTSGCCASVCAQSWPFPPSRSRARPGASFGCLAPSARFSDQPRRLGGTERMPLFFPFSEYWWLYAAFTGAVLVLLALDLGVFHRDAHRVRFREALAW